MDVNKSLKTHLSPLCEQLAVDAVAIVPGANFERLTAAQFHQNERPLVIIVMKDGACAAIVPHLELAGFQALGFEGAIYTWRDQDGYQGAFNQFAAKFPVESIAVEGQSMRYFIVDALLKAHSRIRIVDGEHAISAVRLLKGEQEIELLARAIAISEAALTTTLDQVRIGMSEKEVEAILKAQLFIEGADALAFNPIVAANTNSALPHAHARDDYKIAAGDALLIDFGGVYKGLHADITRTFFIAEVQQVQQRIYECVLAANKAAISAVKCGASAHDIDDAATRVLEDSEFKYLIRHRTGHGLGRLIHESPEIIRGNHIPLLDGMVFTIEPGLYDESLCGIRIEDDILVENGRAKVLTRFDKELRVIA